MITWRGVTRTPGIERLDGDSTQMSALLGTAGELNSDTPVARAVADISNATNDRSAARAHQGAADAIDATIRQIGCVERLAGG